MARLTRQSYRRKTGLKLSKSESALEAAYKEIDVEIVTGSVTLTRVPDVILIEADALSANTVINIVIPDSDPQAYDRQVRMVNRDDLGGTETVDLQVKGAGVSISASSSDMYYIADASSATAPVALT